MFVYLENFLYFCAKIEENVEKDSDILWNFTKFFISKDGQTIQRFAPVAEPKDFEANIVAELAK